MDDPQRVSQDERKISLSEVNEIERKLWQAIGVEGPLGPEVRRLYHVVVSRYEAIILGGGNRAELQEVEYSLWKLHYLHIEEFRKRLKKGPAVGASNGADSHAGGIESFLSEATEYYKGLVGKLKELLGKDGCEGEMTTIRSRKFLCHRFLICIGDLARYKELYQFAENRDSDWSVAAAHYLEATWLWPEGGNPHNQLALLATYVGDDFLALYHCVRSLAVNEPFPDAWKNLIVLLDESRSSIPDSVPNLDSFDFSRPWERILSSLDGHSSNEWQFSTFWRNFIQTISFFFTEFSLVDFKAAFASTVKELESLMELDSVSLNNALASYQFMKPSRAGPFRAIQAVSILIFAVQNLIDHSGRNSVDDTGMARQNLSVQYATAALFIFMGRLVDRCLESTEKAPCPLLPAVVVFTEWWATSNLDVKEILGGNEMSRIAMSYFFRGFSRLLNLLNSQSGEAEFEGCALWEDYELRGFSAARSIQVHFNFSYDSTHMTSFQSGHKCRVNRIIISGIKISERPLVFHERFIYDEKRKEFHYVANVTEGSENQQIGETASEQSVHGRLSVQEEEEVIVFKPLTRHNSAPASKLITPQDYTNEGDDGGGDPTVPPGEHLRRTSTALPTQGQGGNEEASSWEFPMSSRPPSLSAWVVDGKSSVLKKEKTDNMNKTWLPPIEEAPADLLVGRTTTAYDSINAPSPESVITHYPSLPYSAMVPSAPLLPEDTVFGVPDYNSQPGRIIHSDRAAAAPSLSGFVDVYPISQPMTSSEWLRQFRKINNLQQDYNNIPRWPGPSPFHNVAVPQYEPLHPWGHAAPITTPPGSDHALFYSNHQPPQPGYYLPMYGSNEHSRRDRVSYGYPETSPYGYVPSKNEGVDQETLLFYLKQMEWRRLQKDPNLQGPTF